MTKKVLVLSLALVACGIEPVETDGTIDARNEDAGTVQSAAPTGASRSHRTPSIVADQADETVPPRYVLLRGVDSIQHDIARDACARRGLKLLVAPLPELKSHRYWLQDAADFHCSYAANGLRVDVDCGAIIVSEVICNA